jgi:uracil-DNA glycosylase
MAMSEDKAAQIESLLREAAECRACPLWKDATQTVFGEGPMEADILFVGEQPGDREDRVGRPFVGPAGLIFDKALSEAGVDRKRAYVTNAVKHFKFEPRGRLRLHKRPNTGEINVCRRWLLGEIEALKPNLIVRSAQPPPRVSLDDLSPSGKTAAIRSCWRAGCGCS